MSQFMSDATEGSFPLFFLFFLGGCLESRDKFYKDSVSVFDCVNLYSVITQVKLAKVCINLLESCSYMI